MKSKFKQRNITLYFNYCLLVCALLVGKPILTKNFKNFREKKNLWVN